MSIATEDAPARGRSPRQTIDLTGVILLLRQALRRDRIVIAAWAMVMAVMSFASAAATTQLFTTAQEQISLAESINASAALRALYGPLLDVTSVGELSMSKMTVLYATFVCILMVVLVRRHTRTEEESGRAELVGAAVIGREAPLAAAVAEALGVSALIAGAVALASIAGGLDVVGSIWFGLAWCGTGAVATGIGAVAVQISASSRTCGAIAAGAIVLSFATRAVGDAAQWTWLSWLSPLGWNTQISAWSQPRWWVLGLYVALSAVLLLAAQTLRAHRDLNGGLIQPRPGPTSGTIASPLGLLVRTHRTMAVLWTVALAGMALLFGAMAPGLDDMIADAGGQEIIDRMGGALIAAVLSVLAMVITAHPITVISHVAADEVDGRADLVLASARSRGRWFGAAVTVAAVGSAWLMIVSGAAMWVGDALAGGSAPWHSLVAAVLWVPAVWLLAALTLLAYSLSPRLAWVGWVLLTTAVTLSLVGELLEFPDWLIKVSPYSLISQYPIEPINWWAEAGLVAVSLGATAAAWWRFTRRDIG